MKIINRNLNLWLSQQSQICCVSFLTGPFRAALGITQTTINTIALTIFAIPNCLECVKEKYCLHYKVLTRDLGVGLLHILRGCLDCIPVFPFCYDLGPDSNGRIYESDIPFGPGNHDYGPINVNSQIERADSLCVII